MRSRVRATKGGGLGGRERESGGTEDDGGVVERDNLDF